MEIKKPAMAGTMESSDCIVTIRPGQNGIQIDLQSDVKVMFGQSILETVRKTLEELEIKDACNKKLAEYKWIRMIEFVKEMPKTISGKIRKTELRNVT